MDALPDQTPAPDPGHGKLATNIVHFARTLRTAGLRVGPGQILRAVEAVEAAGLSKRDDFYWTLHSVFVNRRDQREIFDQAFHVYWRNPRLLEKMMEMLLPSIDVPEEQDKSKQLSRRLQDALQPGQGEAPRENNEPPEVEIEATFTVSDREVLQQKDFEQMSEAEIDAALCSGTGRRSGAIARKAASSSAWLICSKSFCCRTSRSDTVKVASISTSGGSSLSLGASPCPGCNASCRRRLSCLLLSCSSGTSIDGSSISIIFSSRRGLRQ